MKDTRFNISFDEETGRYYLETNMEDKPKCHICEETIEESKEQPYFCPTFRFFFHKECLLSKDDKGELKDKHVRSILSEKNSQHEDHPVTILRDKKDDNNKEGNTKV